MLSVDWGESILHKKEKNIGIERSAVNLYINIAEQTKVYELQRAIYQFLVPYMMANKDYIQSLQFAKKLYVVTKENYLLSI